MTPNFRPTSPVSFDIPFFLFTQQIPHFYSFLWKPYLLVEVTYGMRACVSVCVCVFISFHRKGFS